jgi:hypothetical protein
MECGVWITKDLHHRGVFKSFITIIINRRVQVVKWLWDFF